MIFVPTIIVFECHEPHLYDSELNKCCVCSDCSIDWLFPHLLLLRPPYSLRQNNIEIRPIDSPCNSFLSVYVKERIAHLSLNQKLGMIKLSRKGWLKAEIDQKARPLVLNS